MGARDNFLVQMLRRRTFLATVVSAGIFSSLSRVSNALAAADQIAGGAAKKMDADKKLPAPANGRIPVAFVISHDVTVIDFAGPWEVFQDVMIPARGEGVNGMPFELFTVSDKLDAIVGSGGLKLIPDHTLETAPPPKVVVVPAQQGSKAIEEWLARISPTTDVTMSVCTGAFLLARAGLLSGKPATTHHLFLDKLAREFPKVEVKRGVRFVEEGKISTAGGLTSGIDLALHVVERYFEREVAQTTADYMEHHSREWIG